MTVFSHWWAGWKWPIAPWKNWPAFQVLSAVVPRKNLLPGAVWVVLPTKKVRYSCIKNFRVIVTKHHHNRRDKLKFLYRSHCYQSRRKEVPCIIATKVAILCVFRRTNLSHITLFTIARVTERRLLPRALPYLHHLVRYSDFLRVRWLKIYPAHWQNRNRQEG